MSIRVLAKIEVQGCVYVRACVSVRVRLGRMPGLNPSIPGGGHCYQGKRKLSGRTGRQRERKDTDR